MMDRDSALSSLETINTVINRTRRELSSDWPYLIWTGGLLILACLVEQWLWLRKVPHALPHLMVWGVFCLLVALGSLAIGRYMERHRGGRIADGLGRKIYAIWGAITAVVLFLVYLALGPKLFNPIHIWALATLLDTLGLFITGILSSSRGFILLSLLGLPVVLFMVGHPLWQPALFGLYIGGGQALIGLLTAGKRRGEA